MSAHNDRMDNLPRGACSCYCSSSDLVQSRRAAGELKYILRPARHSESTAARCNGSQPSKRHGLVQEVLKVELSPQHLSRIALAHECHYRLATCCG